MFQNYEKYVNKSSIFNKVALWGYNFITNEFLFFKVFNHSTELDACSEPCQTSNMKSFARIFIVFLVVNYFSQNAPSYIFGRVLNTPLDNLVVDKPLAELKNYV